jgi:predicted Rossmann fold flavoprotein
VKIFLNERIQELTKTTEFVVFTETEEFRAPVLVVATGGLSIPKMGATPFGYELAKQFGLKIQPTRPALVPLILGRQRQKQYCDLAGVSAEVIASTADAAFREKMLITHRGLSGPAILQISSYWKRGEPIRLDLAPGREIALMVQRAKYRNLPELVAALQSNLPRRFAERWVELHEPESLSNAGLEKFERDVHRWSVVPADTEGYEKAEVTAGGVDTDELSSKTMQSRKMPGLFFVGEAVDVTGHLGGFNFQWAWASAAAAGRAM